MNDLILVAGPPAAGKTTVCRAAGAALGLPVLPVDAMRSTLYPRWGYSEAVSNRLLRAGGALSQFRYEQPFEARLLSRLVKGHRRGLVELGGGFLVQDQPAGRIVDGRSLEGVHHRIMVLPSRDDPAACQRILEERLAARASSDRFIAAWLAAGGRDVVARIVREMFSLADDFWVVETGACRPEDSAAEVCSRLQAAELPALSCRRVSS